ncbi:MAG: nitrogen regulation protein NR(I) [Gammaproteobacteria bacterium]|nr:nitrogen regulation protein NR(I) [Gammaproteobacteria bacterium]
MSGYVWVIDDDPSIRWVLEKALKQSGMQVTCFTSGDEALQLLQDQAAAPNAIISDINMPGQDGITVLHKIKANYPRTPVLIITAFSDLDSTVASFEGGAFEYIQKPFDVDEVIEHTRRACSAGVDNDQPNSSADGSDAVDEEEFQELIGETSEMQEVFSAIARLSRSHVNVLISGESGTGKELIARALHRHSPRAQEPFVALNVAAIPHDSMESELFGHEKGAFSGASDVRRGRFEQAHNGTLFLDEIGDMPLDLQTHLLRVLSDGQFYRMAGAESVKVDVRILAATHQDLEQLVHEGKFREDLYHRINVIRLDAPPLRQRRKDIPRLMQHYLAKAAKAINVSPKTMSPEFEERVMQLPWPGNVRQLQNTAQWLTVMAKGSELTPTDLPKDEQTMRQTKSNTWENSLQLWAVERLHAGDKNLLNQVVPEVERILIKAALTQTQGKRQDAAKLLGWGRNTLTRKIRELEID